MPSATSTWKRYWSPLSRRQPSNTGDDEYNGHPKWALGIMNDKETMEVPGSVRLLARAHNKPLGLHNIPRRRSVSSMPTGIPVDGAVKKTSDGAIILEPQPEDSANDPLNWPAWRRDCALLSLGLYCMVGGGMTPVLAAGFHDIATTYKVDVAQVSLTTGLYMLGMGLGSVVASPTAILYGKRTVYLASAVLLVACSVWCALSPTFGSLVAARVFQGAAVSPVECLPGATISEIFFLHEKAYRIGIYTLLLLGGKNLVPLIGAAIIQRLDWRWVFWIAAAVVVVCAVLLFLFVPESYWDRRPIPKSRKPSARPSIFRRLSRLGGESRRASVIGIAPSSPRNLEDVPTPLNQAQSRASLNSSEVLPPPREPEPAANKDKERHVVFDSQVHVDGSNEGSAGPPSTTEPPKEAPKSLGISIPVQASEPNTSSPESGPPQIPSVKPAYHSPLEGHFLSSFSLEHARQPPWREGNSSNSHSSRLSPSHATPISPTASQHARDPRSNKANEDGVDTEKQQEQQRRRQSPQRKHRGSMFRRSSYTTQLRDQPPRTFRQQLRVYHGRLSRDSWAQAMVRPLILLSYPAVLWSAGVYGCSIGWLAVISESMAVIYIEGRYHFNAFQTGLVYISPFIGGILGTVVAGKVSDVVVMAMARRNNGLYEPEYRLVMVIPIFFTTVIGLMGFGWSVDAGNPWIVPTVFFGVVSFGCSLGSTTAITFCVDSYRQYAGEALVALNFCKNVLHGMVFSFFVTGWLVRDGPKTVYVWIGVIQLLILLTTIPMYVFGKRARMWTVRKNFMERAWGGGVSFKEVKF